MAYNSNTGEITAPVSIYDLQQCFGTVIEGTVDGQTVRELACDLGVICRMKTGDTFTVDGVTWRVVSRSEINRWAKYKPVSLPTIDTVTGQWDITNNLWLATASWWRGVRTSGNNFRRECGFQIPCVDYNAEYRSQVYYYDNRLASGVYTAPWNVPTAAWTYEPITVARMTDFAKYNHTQPQVPLLMTWPASPIRITTSADAFTITLNINNYALRANGSNCAIFANDMEELAGAEFCARLTIWRYEDNILISNYRYEVSGGILSDNNGNLSITVMKKLFMTSASEMPHTDVVSIEPYLRKIISGQPRLLSLGCETKQQRGIVLNFTGIAYKMRFAIGEIDDSLIENMFMAGFTANLAGRTIRPVVGDVVDTETSGHWIRVGGLFAKAIINDVYNVGTLTGTYTVKAFIEDLNCDDYNDCMIPKTQILAFTVDSSNGLQGYGMRGVDGGGDAGTLTMQFADEWNAKNANWDFAFDMIPILLPYAGGEPWPAGTPLNPNNNVITKFRVTCEIEQAGGKTFFSVPQNGDGSYKKTDPAYSPYESMQHWKTGYVFSVLEDGQGGYEVVQEPTCCGTLYSRDSGEVADDLGTAAWMPLPAGWSDQNSIWMTE